MHEWTGWKGSTTNGSQKHSGTPADPPYDETRGKVDDRRGAGQAAGLFFIWSLLVWLAVGNTPALSKILLCMPPILCSKVIGETAVRGGGLFQRTATRANRGCEELRNATAGVAVPYFALYSVSMRGFICSSDFRKLSKSPSGRVACLLLVVCRCGISEKSMVGRWKAWMDIGRKQTFPVRVWSSKCWLHSSSARKSCNLSRIWANLK